MKFDASMGIYGFADGWCPVDDSPCRFDPCQSHKFVTSINSLKQ